jgi:hypothetical protein
MTDERQRRLVTEFLSEAAPGGGSSSGGGSTA